jgi:hypothetical protein
VRVGVGVGGTAVSVGVGVGGTAVSVGVGFGGAAVKAGVAIAVVQPATAASTQAATVARRNASAAP